MDAFANITLSLIESQRRICRHGSFALFFFSRYRPVKRAKNRLPVTAIEEDVKWNFHVIDRTLNENVMTLVTVRKIKFGYI